MIETCLIISVVALLGFIGLWHDAKKNYQRQLDSNEILTEENVELSLYSEKLKEENKELASFKRNMSIALNKLIDDGPGEYSRFGRMPPVVHKVVNTMDDYLKAKAKE